jgi:DNA-binding NtrC family response regulator
MSSERRYTLLAVDEDMNSLRQIELLASKWFTVIATRSPQRALSQVTSDASVTIVIADSALANTTGLSFLKAVQSIRPTARRILLAGPQQVDEVIEGVRCGAVEKVVYKPIAPAEFTAVLSLVQTDRKRATA